MSTAAPAINSIEGEGPAALDVCITFDNLGEAAELEYGIWPDAAPIGRHKSVTEGLPAAMRILERHGVAATFFIEGWNAEHYPQSIRALASVGHEVAFHGWRHENWSSMTTEHGRLLTVRSLDALSGLTTASVGLRPPGGSLQPGLYPMLADLGVTYVSPLGDRPSIVDGMAVLPFAWRAVDALYFEPTMAALRLDALGVSEPCPDRVWRQALEETLAIAVRRGGVLTVIFHAYLLAERPERIATLDWFVGACATHPAITTHRADRLASRLYADSETVRTAA